MKNRPIIGITMGDPSGVGPEIILKLFSKPGIYDWCIPIVIGDRGSLLSAMSKRRDLSINEISKPKNAKAFDGQIDLIPVSRLTDEDMIPGKPSINGGKAMTQYILTAVEMARKGEVAAITTCPINKALMNEAGYKFEGHTQLIAHVTNTPEYVMMLAGERLRVSLVTIHCAIKDVPSLLSEENIYRTIVITTNSLKKDFGIKNPRVAIAALNPHAGESEMFGTEERDIIRPAIERARKGGYKTTDPLPADTLFVKAASGEFDAVVCMYHDQGLIPLKLLHFSDAVNLTLGLPIVRTSVDHGTAYDIAGQGKADPSSLFAAVKMAANIAENRRNR
jgi:4-hydroxythreonine-4-phosphate dehydrogenase